MGWSCGNFTSTNKSTGKHVCKRSGGSWNPHVQRGLPGIINHWSNFYLQKMWYTNSSFYWWYGASDEDSKYSDEELAAISSKKITRRIARDKDVRLDWTRLKCTLMRAIATRSQKEYEAQKDFGNFECTQ